jgi:acyl-coenzyme A synthetase/AMP-(fatty) acid ligase
LQSGGSLCAELPFYPADVCAAIAAAPRPRILVSTPVHLRALAGAVGDPPAVDLIVSATAPLAQDLARTVETRFAAPLHEIYGSTETGQIAGRRTRDTDQWRLWPEVRLEACGGATFADGGHIERRTELADVIEITGPGTFRLHGRTADLVNVAGKRSSFAYLNQQLNDIPGVLDGIFFEPSETRGAQHGVTRLAAAVVAPGLSPAALTGLLRRRIDPVFLPRPLLLVERLPRNATGKLPLESLQALLGPRR